MQELLLPYLSVSRGAELDSRTPCVRCDQIDDHKVICLFFRQMANQKRVMFIADRERLPDGMWQVTNLVTTRNHDIAEREYRRRRATYGK